MSAGKCCSGSDFDQQMRAYECRMHRGETILIVDLDCVVDIGKHGGEGELRRNALIETVADRRHLVFDRALGVEAPDHARRLARGDCNDLCPGAGRLKAERVPAARLADPVAANTMSALDRA